MTRTNYIFVDFENVQETDLDRIANKPVKVTLVLGKQHKQLPVALVKKLQKYHAQVTLVETGRDGKNALDLVLALHIGEVKKGDPDGSFHIVSKDKDFDALIGYLKDNGTPAARYAGFNEIPVLMNGTEQVGSPVNGAAQVGPPTNAAKPVGLPTNAAERVRFVASRLKKQIKARPKKKKTLESYIQAAFGKTLLPAQVEEIIRGLLRGRFITISKEGVVGYGNL